MIVFTILGAIAALVIALCLFTVALSYAHPRTLLRLQQWTENYMTNRGYGKRADLNLDSGHRGLCRMRRPNPSQYYQYMEKAEKDFKTQIECVRYNNLKNCTLHYIQRNNIGADGLPHERAEEYRELWGKDAPYVSDAEVHGTICVAYGMYGFWRQLQTETGGTLDVPKFKDYMDGSIPCHCYSNLPVHQENVWAITEMLINEGAK